MRVITHSYDSYDQATSVVAALEAAGVPHTDVTLVSGDVARAPGEPVHDSHEGAGTGATFGSVFGGGIGLVAGLGMLALPGAAPILAAGWLVATITGAGIGAAAGGLGGALTDLGIDQLEAHGYATHVAAGGTLVSVRAADDMVASVEAILEGDVVPVPADDATFVQRRPSNHALVERSPE